MGGEDLQGPTAEEMGEGLSVGGRGFQVGEGLCVKLDLT